MLLDPCDMPGIGTLRNRVVMAPMTRNFAPGHLATEQVAAYYGRRAAAGAGLIVTEGTFIHQTGDGYRDVPYIETPAQAAAWRPVVERVPALALRADQPCRFHWWCAARVFDKPRRRRSKPAK
jgi:N-ethylmaleimide reductase